MVKVILKKNLSEKSGPKEGDIKSETNNFEPQTSLGRFLREARKNKGLSPTRLSEMSRIPLWHLKSIEEGNYENLPPEVYLRGVFSRLAKFLELSPKDILVKYYKENPQSKIAEEVFSPTPRPLNLSYWAITPKKIAVFSSILFLILIFAYLWYQYNVFIGPPTLVLLEPQQDLEVLSPEIKIKGNTDSDVNLTINGQDVYVNQDGLFDSTVNLTAGINAVEIHVKNRRGEETTIVRRIFYKTENGLNDTIQTQN